MTISIALTRRSSVDDIIGLMKRVPDVRSQVAATGIPVLVATGDLGHLDEAGRLFIDGREDDMVVSGGENVYPAEVEELLAGHPGIVEVAVIGVPDEAFGQALAAFVVPVPGTRLRADEVRSYVRERLARYKVPRRVSFLDALPRNATGKVLKRSLA